MHIKTGDLKQENTSSAVWQHFCQREPVKVEPGYVQDLHEDDPTRDGNTFKEEPMPWQVWCLGLTGFPVNW